MCYHILRIKYRQRLILSRITEHIQCLLQIDDFVLSFTHLLKTLKYKNTMLTLFRKRGPSQKSAILAEITRGKKVLYFE